VITRVHWSRRGSAAVCASEVGRASDHCAALLQYRQRRGLQRQRIELETKLRLIEGRPSRLHGALAACTDSHRAPYSGSCPVDSDVDLFFDYERGKLGLYELMDVKEAAAKILGEKTDIMTRDSLHRTVRQRIEADALQVF
jgi:hypothetical protein